MLPKKEKFKNLHLLFQMRQGYFIFQHVWNNIFLYVFGRENQKVTVLTHL